MNLIETKTLYLGKITSKDAEDFHRICNQSFVLKWMDDWEMDYSTTERLILHFIRGYAVKDPEKHPYIIALRLKDSDKLIGICGFGPKEELGGETEIAYFIDEAYANKGYMSEAVKAAIDFYFALTGKNYISALVVDDNIHSKKILVKNGFVFHEVDDPNGVVESHYRLYKNKILLQ